MRKVRKNNEKQRKIMKNKKKQRKTTKDKENIWYKKDEREKNKKKNFLSLPPGPEKNLIVHENYRKKSQIVHGH